MSRLEQTANLPTTAYNKNAPPPAISGFTGPVELGGAINAPNSYMGYQFFPFSQTQGFDPSTCASACTAQTTYDESNPNPDCSYQPCVSLVLQSKIVSANGTTRSSSMHMFFPKTASLKASTARCTTRRGHRPMAPTTANTVALTVIPYPTRTVTHSLIRPVNRL